VPLLREGVAFGTIQLRRTQVAPFSEKQRQLLETFADQAVIAIENARLFGEVQARTREVTEALEQQTATSEVLQVISRSPGELEPVFEAMLANAIKLCDAKMGNITLCEGDALRVITLQGAPASYAEERRRNPVIRPRPETMLGRALVTKQAIQIADIRDEVGHDDSSALDMLALKREASAIPIVFTMVYDPIRSGFVESLARPGGNVTGFTLGEFSLGGKMLELLKEMAPQVNRVAVVLNSNQPPHVAMLQAIEAVASSFAVRVTAAEVKNAAEIEPAIDVFAREPNGGLIVVPSPIVSAHRELVAALAARYRLPAIYGYRDFVKSGGMVSYGADPTDMFRRAALYVDRILKGEKPGELPVQNPNKFELIVNLKTAKALGLTISESFLLRADEVIE
jgi:ABC-type uncharacterized transport system substrate-binding protein